MRDYVFVGPTLQPGEVGASLPGAICLPPVAQGDVYRVTQQHPRAIGIIDGYFSGAPSVWHKEILWALSQGIFVYGSASMGALRAAEIYTFGMRGVGRVFEAFRDGALEDDDEVAVIHGPPETGFLALSEPMVNIRATLERAEHEGAISRATRCRVESTAKAMFFPDRNWPGVLRAAAEGAAGEEELARLRQWLPGGMVDQKREDALEMLAAMRSGGEWERPVEPAFRFEPTHFWHDLVERSADASDTASATADVHILDELRLLGYDAYKSAESLALLRMLVDQDAEATGSSISIEEKAAVSTRIRTAHNLFSHRKLQNWMSENDLDERSFERLVENEAHVERLVDRYGLTLDQFLLNALRLSCLYRELSTRARDKADRLEKHAASHPHHQTVVPNVVELRAWHFERRLNQPIPDDLQAYAQALGFKDLADFDHALQREWLYSKLADGKQRN